MSLGTINEVKELALTYQPLILAEFTFQSGPKLRVASHPLNVAEGGFQYDGYDWQARIVSYDITATQALSESGIDYTPQVSITMADADRNIWLNYQQAVGFKGATVKLRFIFWKVGSNEFTTDYRTPFVGICASPQVDSDTITVAATSKMNMTPVMLPQVRVQRRCPWIFPVPVRDGAGLIDNTASAARYQEAADDESSQFWFCGYSPQASGSNACGNLNGGTPYTTCNYTYEDCLARMGNGQDITKDSSNRPSGRFGGIHWSIPNTSNHRAYVSGKWEEITTTDNEAKYGDFVPLHYGKGWTDPLILTTDGSTGDLTKMHVLLGVGKFSGIDMVLVNGTIIPHTFDDTEMSYVSPGVSNATDAMKSGWWKCINNGDRNGNVAGGIAVNEQPDPYGNLCVIEVVVPKKLADAASVPRVQVLASGPPLQQYRRITSITVSGGVATVYFPTVNNDLASNDPHFHIEISGNSLPGINGSYSGLTNFTYGPPGTISFNCPGVSNGTGTGGWVRWKGFTDNLAWIMMDVLTWANWRYNNLSVDSWVDYGDVCRTPIPYKDQFGNTATHPRYTGTLVLRQKRSAADILRGLRNAGRAMLFLDADGNLGVKHKGTLASQQPNPVPGSNYNTPVPSRQLDGSAANGYVAYDFHEGNIAKKQGSKGAPSLEIQQRSLNDTPNRVTFNFQDMDNRYIPDSMTVVDAEDVARVGQELPGQIAMDGINNVDQGNRCTRSWMAENFRGNDRVSVMGDATGDTGGTLTYQWETTFRVVHLAVGDICRLSYQNLGISNQLVRIIKIQPTSNFSRCTITALHHNDLWYLDAFGQGDQGLWRPDFRNRELRPSFGWCPYTQQPLTGDSLYDRDNWTFGLSQEYGVDAQGTAVARLNVEGKLPVNVFSDAVTPPFLTLQGTTASTGGTIRGGRTYYFIACSVDADGLLSAPSRMMSVAVPEGTDTNTVTVPVKGWPSTAQGWVLFAGPSPHRFCFQKEGSGLPSSITLTTMKTATWGVPDGEFNSMSLDLYNVIHSGNWGAEVAECTANTIKVGALPGPNAGFATNQWAGYDVTLLGQRGADGVPLPVFNARVASNTSDTLTLVAGSPDPSAVIQPRDVLVCRFKPTVGENWVKDVNLVNNLNGLGDMLAVTDATNETPVTITVAGGHGCADDDRVYVSGCTGNDGANGLWPVQVVSADTLILTGSAGTGTYTGGGSAAKLQYGLVQGAEKGAFLYFFAGTGEGMWVKVADNTEDTYFIEGSWPVTPDATSRFIVVGNRIGKTWLQEAINNTSKDAICKWNVDVTNNRGQVLLARCNTLDGAGDESLSPVWREIYLFGLPPGERRITADAVVQRTDRTLLVNAAENDINVTLRPIAEMAGFSLTLLREDTSGHTVTVTAVNGDTVNGAPTVTLDVGTSLIITGTS